MGFFFAPPGKGASEKIPAPLLNGSPEVNIHVSYLTVRDGPINAVKWSINIAKLRRDGNGWIIDAIRTFAVDSTYHLIRC